MASLKRAVSLFYSRNFTFAWLGQTISTFGNQAYSLAIIWLITTLTHSPSSVGTVLAFGYIPNILLLIVGGAWADRVSPKQIILWLDVIRTFITLALAIAVTLGYISLPTVIVFVIIYGLTKAFFDPALGNFILSLISPNEYNAVNVLQQFSREGANLLGPILGGYLIAKYSIGAALAFDAITFAISVVSLLLIRQSSDLKGIERPATTSPKSLSLGGLTEGFRFLWKEQGMLIIVLLFAITNALNDVEAVLVPLLARITLKMTAEQYGLMTSFFGIGTVSGIFLVGILGNHIRFRALLICGSMVLFGGAIIAMGLAQEAKQLYGAYFLFGLSYIVADIVSLTLWMQLIPESLRGRVFSTIAALAMALNPLGFVLASVLGNIYGIRTGIWIGGGLVILSGLLALLFRSVRNLDHQAKSVFSTESD